MSKRPPLRASIPLACQNARRCGRLFPLACHKRPPLRASIPPRMSKRPPLRASIPPSHVINARRCGRLFLPPLQIYHICRRQMSIPPLQIYHICRRQMSIPPLHSWRGGGRQAGGEVKLPLGASHHIIYQLKSSHPSDLNSSILSMIS